MANRSGVCAGIRRRVRRYRCSLHCRRPPSRRERSADARGAARLDGSAIVPGGGVSLRSASHSSLQPRCARSSRHDKRALSRRGCETICDGAGTGEPFPKGGGVDVRRRADGTRSIWRAREPRWATCSIRSTETCSRTNCFGRSSASKMSGPTSALILSEGCAVLRLSSSWLTAENGRGVLHVSGEHGGSDDRVRCRRDHAAEVDVVRT